MPSSVGAMPDATGAMPAPVRAPSDQTTQQVRIGELLGGRYRVDQRIGVGGMAEVYRGHDMVLGRDVAIKLFRNDAELPEGANGEQRRGAELQALARLAHPNLITLYDGMVNPRSPGERAYLVMELIDGPNLAGKLSGGALAEPVVRLIGGQIASALAYVHAQGMVHRDVKPANILLGHDASGEDSQARARLSDFGIVRLLGSEHVTSVNMLVGTASYLAPEQARGEDVGPAGDVYALGLVLLEALTGERCFEGSPLEVAMARLSRSPDVPAGLPAPWPSLLTAMTAMSAEQRPSASDVAEVLRGTTDTAWIPAVASNGASDAMTSAMPPAWLAADAARSHDAAGYDGFQGGHPDGYRDGGHDDGAAPYRRSRRRLALLAAAAVAAAVLGASGYLLAQSPGKGTGVPASTPTVSHQAPATHTSAPQNTAANTGAQQSAPSTTAAPSTSAPPTSAPHTSAAPRTSAAPSTAAATNVAPSTAATSSAATSSTPASGAPASAPTSAGGVATAITS